jgi:nucleoside-diphosphate-sugar epimerase
MRIVIAGGHGKIALLLEHILAERGDQAVGLIRNPAHVGDVQKAGAEAVVCDRDRPEHFLIMAPGTGGLQPGRLWTVPAAMALTSWAWSRSF